MSDGGDSFELKPIYVACIVIAAIGLLVAGIAALAQSQQTSGKAPLRVAAAAGQRAALEPAVVEYRRLTGKPVEIVWGGTGALYTQIAMSNGTLADVFISADEVTIERGQSDGWLQGNFAIANQTTVLAVQRGNPKSIHSMDDLLREDVILSLPDPDQTATGWAARAWLLAQGKWEAVRKAVRVMKPTVNDSAADVQVGAADATFVFDHMLRAGGWPALELAADVGIPGEQATATIITNSAQTDAGRQFIDWLTAPTGGRLFYQRAGFEVPSP